MKLLRTEIVTRGFGNTSLLLTRGYGNPFILPLYLIVRSITKVFTRVENLVFKEVKPTLE